MILFLSVTKHVVPPLHFGSLNAGYVNRFGRGLQAPARFRFSSTVDPPGRITRFVGKQYPVASDFEAISSPLERQFSSSSLHPAGGAFVGLSLIYRSRGHQALQFIREGGYLTGDLPHLLGQLLRQAVSAIIAQLATNSLGGDAGSGPGLIQHRLQFVQEAFHVVQRVVDVLRGRLVLVEVAVEGIGHLVPAVDVTVAGFPSSRGNFATRYPARQ